MACCARDCSQPWHNYGDQACQQRWQVKKIIFLHNFDEKIEREKNRA